MFTMKTLKCVNYVVSPRPYMAWLPPRRRAGADQLAAHLPRGGLCALGTPVGVRRACVRVCGTVNLFGVGRCEGGTSLLLTGT